MLRMTQPMLRRTSNIFGGHVRRAKEMHQVLDYTLHDLRTLVADALMRPCPYCGETLGATTTAEVDLGRDEWQIDHDIPTSRGGPHALGNLRVCCRPCNEMKGVLTGAEFRAVRAAMTVLAPVARQDLQARLRAGAARRAGQ